MADELVIAPFVSFRPTRPPTIRAFGTLSATKDCEPEIVPELMPTNPPTMLSDPAVT